MLFYKLAKLGCKGEALHYLTGCAYSRPFKLMRLITLNALCSFCHAYNEGNSRVIFLVFQWILHKMGILTCSIKDCEYRTKRLHKTYKGVIWLHKVCWYTHKSEQLTSRRNIFLQRRVVSIQTSSNIAF